MHHASPPRLHTGAPRVLTPRRGLTFASTSSRCRDRKKRTNERTNDPKVSYAVCARVPSRAQFSTHQAIFVEPKLLCARTITPRRFRARCRRRTQRCSCISDRYNLHGKIDTQRRPLSPFHTTIIRQPTYALGHSFSISSYVKHNSGDVCFGNHYSRVN